MRQEETRQEKIDCLASAVVAVSLLADRCRPRQQFSYTINMNLTSDAEEISHTSSFARTPQLAAIKWGGSSMSIWLGNEKVRADDLLDDLRLQRLLLEQQILGLQEYLDTRNELIAWLEGIQEES